MADGRILSQDIGYDKGTSPVASSTWRLYGSLPASLMKKRHTSKNACATNTSESEDSPGREFVRLDAALPF